MPKSPTQLSLAHLRDNGYLVEVTERWNPFAKIRQDLFGIVDLLALKDQETLAIQTTSRANMSARANKIADSPNIAAIRKAGWRFEIHGWDKYKGKWRVKIEDVS